MDYRYRAELIKVIDGDSVWLQVDLGFRMFATIPIRLAHINAPELRAVGGAASRDWTIEWFEKHSTFEVATAKNPEKYGRWLGVVYAEDGSVLNDELLTAGHAEPYA